MSSHTERGASVSAALRRRRRQCGAAMTEAVIMLPFFIMIFAALMYVHRVHSARHSARLQARTCAWIYSNGACDISNPCGASATPSKSRSDIDPGAINQTADGATIPQNEHSQSMVDSVQSRMDGGLSSLLGEGVTIRAQRELDLPFFLGGGTQIVSEDYHLACNLKSKTFVEVLGDILNPLGW